MENIQDYGLYRSIEPKNSLPQPAWKLNNKMFIRKSEILIDVEIININLVSFNEIVNTAQADKERIKKRIFEIIEERGKLHNPVTGTGGMLYGKVEKIGVDYPNYNDVKIGDEIISLASLSLTPLFIEEIIDIDLNLAQIKVKGKAILFASVPLIKTPNDIPLKLLIAVLDEAGAPAQVHNITNKGDRILIIGGNGKLGLLCAYAAKKKIGKCGKIYCVVDSVDSKQLLGKLDVFDDVIHCDATNTINTYNKAIEKGWKEFDVVINCINYTGTEMISLLLTKNQGKIFFASLASNYKMTALMAEGVSKDVSIIPYSGYKIGHASFTIDLLKSNKDIKLLLSKILKNNIKIGNTKTIYKPDITGEALNNYNLKDYIINSEKIREVYDAAMRVSKYYCTVMILGESGVGKEFIAQTIHTNSERNYFPFIKINCASIPEGLLESELFGYEKGAFTGANNNGKMGFFEMAQNGTLFLDEIGELPFKLQGKLLRVLQEQEIYRIGGTNPIKVDVRIIAATNKDLELMMKQKLFRDDLYYRLNVFPIRIPPLRERKEDIIPLLKLFIGQYNEKFKINKQLTDDVYTFLSNYDWPGNIREVQNYVQRLLINTSQDVITLNDINEIKKEKDVRNLAENTLNLKKIINEVEYKLLVEAKNKYKTSRRAARALGISQSTYIKKLQKHSIGDSKRNR